MNKNEMINEIVAELSQELNKEQLDRVKITLQVKMSGYELREMQTLPSTQVFDNEFILRRFSIDALAKGTKPSSIETYINMLKPFFCITGLNYRAVTSQDIIDYIAKRQYTRNTKGQYPSQNYISTISRTLFVFFQWAYRKHYIDTDIMLDVDRIKPKQKKKDRLTNEEVEKIREITTDPRDRALFELMMCTGMRVGEIALLRIEDINFDDMKIHIRGYKSDDSDRDGYLSIKAKLAIKKYIGSRTSGYLFIAKKAPGTKAMTEGCIEKMAKALGERIDAHCSTTVHIYRKTFASELYSKTKNVKTVSILLGHANTAVTEKYYLVDDMEDIRYQMLKVA